VRSERADHYHQKAKREGFRSRAAYKLLEIQREQRLLRPGQRVVDLGCWPGGWLQVASRAVGARGRVVGVDVAPIEPALENENVVALVGDITEARVAPAILEALGGRAEVLLSDAAPKLSGIRVADRAREEALLEAIEARVPELLAPGGSLLVKLLDCPEAEQVARRLRTRFEKARVLKPSATRKGSSERYLVARGYRAGG
jgi:23S rRNA (uridine2552-2'-O)-methyltransferase